MKDENKEPEFKPMKSPLERLGENLEVLRVGFDKMKTKQGDTTLRLKRANAAIDNLRYDLADPKREFGYTPTREVAVAALKMAKGFISTENLEGHKVIKDLAEELDKYVGQANTKFVHLRREIEDIPSPDNMHDLLNSDFMFTDLNKKVENSEERLDNMVASIMVWTGEFNDFKETYNEAAHPTRSEFNEFKSDYAELVHKFNCIINYIVGYTTGKDSETSAHILKAYEHNPKKESKDNEDPQTTSNKSE